VTEKRVVTSNGADVYSKIPRVYVFGMFVAHEPSLGNLQRDVFLGGTSRISLQDSQIGSTPPWPRSEPRPPMAYLSR